MKHFSSWLVAALFVSACSSGPNSTARGTGSSGGSDAGGSSPSAGSGNGTATSGNTSVGGGNSLGGAGNPAGGATPGGGVASGSGGTVTGSGGTAVGATLTCTAPNNGSPTLRLLTRYELENTLNDVFPSLKGLWTDSLPANTLSDSGFDNDASNQAGNQLVSGLFDTAQSIADAVVGSGFQTLLPCSATTADHACAETFLAQYGRRLFRRPPTQAEHDRYLAYFDTAKTASDFKTAIRWMTVGLIQSPNAVYRSELCSGTDIRKLSSYEVATELAYTFTGSTPSDDLLTKAANNTIGDPVAVAKALLATDAGKRLVQRFFEGYLGYTRVSSMAKTAIPTFSTIGPDMVLETRAFIDDVVLQKRGGLKELLTSPTSNPSKALATYYGYLPAPATDYATVTRPAGKGVGILAQGSFLASHANSEASSPTQRGLFPFYRLLCQQKLTPPANVPAITAAVATNTTRERYEIAHMMAGTSCPGCHKHFDPIGFGFEHFDEAGKYRDTQGGENINSAATVPAQDLTPIFTFTGEDDLAAGFANLPESYECFAAYVATYAAKHS